MDIYEYLVKDHRLVDTLCEQLLRARSATRRKELFHMIRNELSLHADTEEATFYKALEAKGMKEKMEHAEEEHDEIRHYLDVLDNVSITSEKWIEQFGEFKHAVSHHVKEEEEQIFEKARRLLSASEAAALAKEMDALKKRRKPNAA